MSMKKFIFRKSFLPHTFGNKIILKESPKILISQEVLNDINMIINSIDVEIGFMGCVLKQGTNYVVTEVFVPEQEVTATTTEISTAGLAKMTEELLARGDEGVEKFNSMRLWGHSHVNMGTTASGTDETQTNEFMKDIEDFFIRLIVNKLGRMEFWVYDKQNQTVIQDCEWCLMQVLPEDAQTKWIDEIKKNVSEKKWAGYYQAGMYDEDYYDSITKHTFPKKNQGPKLTEQKDDPEAWLKKHGYVQPKGGHKI